MSIRSYLLSIAATIGLLSCGDHRERVTDHEVPPPIVPPATNSPEIESSERSEIIRRGREAAAALKGNLFNAQFRSAVESSGAASALQICQTAAQPITDGTAKQFEGVRLRRTSLKLRSPANDPDALDLEVLAAFQARHDAGMEIPTEMVELTENGVARYYEPVFVQKVCLNCHGSRDKMEPAVVKNLALLYPEDQAYGYEEGDFRGVIRADIDPLPEQDRLPEQDPLPEQELVD